MTKFNEFEKIAKRVGKYAKGGEDDPYEYALKEVKMYVKNEEYKLKQIKAECNGSDYEKTSESLVVIFLGGFTCSELILNFAQIFTEEKIFYCIVALFVIVAFICIVWHAYRKFNDIICGKKYIIEVLKDYKIE